MAEEQSVESVVEQLAVVAVEQRVAVAEHLEPAAAVAAEVVVVLAAVLLAEPAVVELGSSNRQGPVWLVRKE